MIYSDTDLKSTYGTDWVIQREVDGALVAIPFPELKIEPASIDLTLDSTFHLARYYEDYPEAIDPTKDNFASIQLSNPNVPKPITIKQNSFILGQTKEIIKLSNRVAAQVATRSTSARWGIDVCHAAGWIDPGYHGRITLELTNQNPQPLLLKEGMQICQIVIMGLRTPCTKPYSGVYNGINTILPKSISCLEDVEDA